MNKLSNARIVCAPMSFWSIKCKNLSTPTNACTLFVWNALKSALVHLMFGIKVELHACKKTAKS
jgi:hypothetical protein